MKAIGKFLKSYVEIVVALITGAFGIGAVLLANQLAIEHEKTIGDQVKSFVETQSNRLDFDKKQAMQDVRIDAMRTIENICKTSVKDINKKELTDPEKQQLLVKLRYFVLINGENDDKYILKNCGQARKIYQTKIIDYKIKNHTDNKTK